MPKSVKNAIILSHWGRKDGNHSLYNRAGACPGRGAVKCAGKGRTRGELATTPSTADSVPPPKSLEGGPCQAPPPLGPAMCPRCRCICRDPLAGFMNYLLNYTDPLYEPKGFVSQISWDPCHDPQKGVQMDPAAAQLRGISVENRGLVMDATFFRQFFPPPSPSIDRAPRLPSTLRFLPFFSPQLKTPWSSRHPLTPSLFPNGQSSLQKHHPLPPLPKQQQQQQQCWASFQKLQTWWSRHSVLPAPSSRPRSWVHLPSHARAWPCSAAC